MVQGGAEVTVER